MRVPLSLQSGNNTIEIKAENYFVLDYITITEPAPEPTVLAKNAAEIDLDIAALPAPELLTRAHVNVVDEISVLYNGLSDSDKKTVKNAALLETLIQRNSQIKRALQKERVAPVIAMIEALPEVKNVTAYWRKMIREAQLAYYKLDAADRELVSNAEKLVSTIDTVLNLSKDKEPKVIIDDSMPNPYSQKPSDFAIVQIGIGGEINNGCTRLPGNLDKDAYLVYRVPDTYDYFSGLSVNIKAFPELFELEIYTSNNGSDWVVYPFSELKESGIVKEDWMNTYKFESPQNFPKDTLFVKIAIPSILGKTKENYGTIIDRVQLWG